jgi:hypothetical protein
MDPKSAIDAYVDEIVLAMPARQRKDVGLELRDLLTTQLEADAESAGRAPDMEMTKAMLKRFGAPGEVARGYLSGADTIIPAREGALFAWLACGAVLAQWALSFPIEVALNNEGDLATRLGVWFWGAGLHAFALPGALAFAAMVWAWRKQRASGGEPVTLSFLQSFPAFQPTPTVAINRVAWGVALIGFGLGMPIYALAPEILSRLEEPARSAMALDPGFVQTRAPALLLLWIVQLPLFVTVFIEGRWRPLTRNLQMGFDLIGAGLLVWFASAGPMFLTKGVDDFAKIVAVGVALLIVFVTAIRFWREQARVGDAKAPAK